MHCGCYPSQVKEVDEICGRIADIQASYAMLERQAEKSKNDWKREQTLAQQAKESLDAQVQSLQQQLEKCGEESKVSCAQTALPNDL